MTEIAVPGRHRAAGRHNPLTEITGMIARVGENGVKASAVVAASGGLVAAFALPAQASTTSIKAAPQAATLLATSAKGSAFAATTIKAPAAAIAPAVVAPSAAAPVAAATVGVLGFEGVEKPAPPAPVVEAASRSTARTPIEVAAPAPAPAVNVPASVGGGVLGVAAAYSGIWYLYGGNTPAGFDCSGFTQFVFGQVGISLPRTAQDQRNASTPVADPQPGDLVFFGSGYAYHVGIYAGNGMMYDSPRSGTQSGLHPIWTTDVTYGRV